VKLDFDRLNYVKDIVKDVDRDVLEIVNVQYIGSSTARGCNE
jgi:hypothetical protein